MLNALPCLTASLLPAAANAPAAIGAVRADDLGTPRGGFAGVLNQAKAQPAGHGALPAAHGALPAAHGAPPAALGAPPAAQTAPAATPAPTTTTAAPASAPVRANRAPADNAAHLGGTGGPRVKAMATPKPGATKPGAARAGAPAVAPAPSGARAATPAAQSSDEAAAASASADPSENTATTGNAALDGPAAPASAALPPAPSAIGPGMVGAPLTLEITQDPSAAAAAVGIDPSSGSAIDAPTWQTALLNGAIAVANAGVGAAPMAAPGTIGADQAGLIDSVGAGTPDSAADPIAPEAAAPGLGSDPALAAATSANAVPAAVAAALAPPSSALPAAAGASAGTANASANAASTLAALGSGAGASASGVPVQANATPLPAAQPTNQPTTGPAGQGTAGGSAEPTELAIVPNASAAPLAAEGATANALPNPAAGLSFAAGLADALATPGSGQSAAPTELQLPAPVHSPEFAPALGLTISTLAANGVQQARLQLHPAELGPISVQIAVDGSGARVDFQADVAQTRQAIEASLPALAGALREAGLTLTGGGVSQQSTPSGQSGQGHGRGARQGRSGRGDDGTAALASVSRATTRRGLVDLMA